MSFVTRRTLAARQDLEDLWFVIAVHDPDAADRQLDRIEAAIAGLSDFPFVGPSPEDLFSGARAILRSPYLAIYRIDEVACVVEILRVVDARRDLVSLNFGL